jgi:hypothetical protein
MAGTTNVMVATPCYGGVVTQRYMTSVFGLLQLGDRAGWAVSLELLGYDSLITRSRNTLLSRFLAASGATHLLFIDADIGFAASQVARMVDFDEGVVAGLYPLKSADWTSAAIGRVIRGESLETAPLRYVGVPCEEPLRQQRDGFVTGTYAGTGFMLIRRDVILRLTRAYPNLRYRGTHGGVAGRPDQDEFALFDCMIDPDTGIYLSEDYAFCRRWRDLGGEIWLDTQGELVHTGPCDFEGRPGVRYPQASVPLPRAAE